MRRVVIAIGVFLLLLLIPIAILRRSRREEPKSKHFTVIDPAADPQSSLSKRFVSSRRIEENKPDPAAARLALARALHSMPLHRVNEWTQNLEAVHGGASPEFREFARAYIAAAGDTLVPFTRALLAECESDEAKFLLAAVLGEARRADTIPLLQEIVAQKSIAAAAALYSIGMARAPEGLSYLKSWLDTARSTSATELGPLLAPALAAIGQHGADSIDLLLQEARLRRGHESPSSSDIVGLIRGESALDRLSAILKQDEELDLKSGAITALGSSTDAKAMDLIAGLTNPAYAAHALLAPRLLPDVWAATGARRTQIAADLIRQGGIPTGDWKLDFTYTGLARLLPPGDAKPLYESLTATMPSGPKIDPYDWIRTLVTTFADQPDLPDRVARLAEAANIHPNNLHRALDSAMERSVHPGRNLGPTALAERIIAFTKDPATPNWMSISSLRPVMRSGISEQALSEVLESGWAERTVGLKFSLLGSILGGAAPQYPATTLQYTQPRSFLESVLEKEADPLLQMRAAYAYLSGPMSSSPNPAAVRAVTGLVQSGDVGRSEPIEATFMMPVIIGSWYARYGTKEDLAKLPFLPDQYPLPAKMSAEYRAHFKTSLARELKRAADAIRLSSN